MEASTLLTPITQRIIKTAQNKVINLLDFNVLLSLVNKENKNHNCARASLSVSLT
jgi:hypothetical protein